MRGHFPLGVEDDAVNHIGLGGHSCHVLLEGGKVVEEQRDPGHCRQVLREQRAPALDFIDDGRSLAVLDHRDDRGHDEEEDQDCPQEKPGLE